ncbi:MAG: hypothetical protein IH597_17070 [Bacteroidales bacterium]|nr:hypothetical protein [Bacteroidales bacterium]
MQPDSMRRFMIHLIADLVIVLSSFIIVSGLYPAPVEDVITRYQSPFIFFVILFLIVSFFFNKYENDRSRTFLFTLKLYAQAFISTISISLLAMYLLQLTYYSRLIILGTMLGIAVLEFVWIALFQTVQYLFFRRNKTSE